MAKNKGPNRTTKNVFKVAGSRTLRIKSKTQKVSINLKKLDLKSKNSSKEKTNQVNQQLAELCKEVHQAKVEKKSELSENLKAKRAINTQTKKPPIKMETEATTSLVKDLQI